MNFKEAISLINTAKKILLISHRRPDGDTLGASVGLHLALAQMSKQTVLACIDDVPQRLAFITDFLPDTHKFQKELDLDDFDLIIVCDAGAHHMTGFHEKYPDFLEKRVPIINIDHHGSNDNFGTVNIVDTKASSATMIIYKLLKQLPVKITREIASVLLAGIYSDTGAFMHSNTTEEAFEIAAELSAFGVSMNVIVRQLFRQATLGQLRLWGYILENMRKNEKKILSSVVAESDFKVIGAHSSDTGGIIDLMNTVTDTTYSLLLAEDEGVVKGSLRTQRDDVNLSDIAAQFGGGGHPKASGFRVNGKLEKQIVWRIVPASL